MKKITTPKGIIITLTIYLASLLISSQLNFTTSFIPKSFTTHSSMLLFSVVGIFLMRNEFTYKIALPKVKTLFKPILIAVLSTFVLAILTSILIKNLGGNIEPHPLMTKLKPVQILIFIFFYASIAEEMLFRGFLMNSIKSLEKKYITFLKIKLSLPVIISGILFGLAHLVLLFGGVGIVFAVRIVIFTSTLGLVAGYYQEKYNNNVYAIIVHMAGNSFAVIAAFAMN